MYFHFTFVFALRPCTAVLAACGVQGARARPTSGEIGRSSPLPLSTLQAVTCGRGVAAAFCTRPTFCRASMSCFSWKT